jgi:exodeoxyribonuclease VII large subunit
VYRVSELLGELRDVCADAFGWVWVRGEIGSLHRSQLGHVHFELRDGSAVVRAVLFRREAQALRFALKDGLHVQARARIDVYAERGQLQLVVGALAIEGEGALQLAFEELKQRLAAEGLFDASHKKPLPAWPRRIGLVTSLGGAALHDFVRALRRREAPVELVLCDARVQGPDAWRDVVRALHLLADDPSIEVIVLARGGGSLQDLWTFNREEVVRAVFETRTPVVSAIGHELDVVLTDAVADARAATPTAAAELVAPDGRELALRLERLRRQLLERGAARLRALEERLEGLQRGVIHPRARLAAAAARVDAAAQALERAARRQLERGAARLERSGSRLSGAAELELARRDGRMGALAAQLDALSPLRVLARGYAVARRARDGAILRSSRDVAVGERVALSLARGALRAQVVETLEPETPNPIPDTETAKTP